VSESSSLRSELRTFAVAELGGENPLPMVGPPLETPYRITGAIPAEIIEGSRYGNPHNLYPYQEQADYGRELHERRLRTVVLENEHLRAVFLPELGGRLWELFDKNAGKHLVHTGGAIQFANLALRNAWFAGGIEWNIGTRGHSPTTCSPLHAAVVRTDTGLEALRMWEFDRLREVVFQVDAWLPADSRVLLVSIRIRNPNRHTVPMYWWTNAAVPQSENVRVVAPANSAFASDDTEGIARVTPTDDDGVDCTWPARNRRARDFFFDLAAETRPWILAADEDGDGLAMLSTARLRGRKLFVWGEGPGGHRWQEWLTPAGTRYAEIQAGLAQTQFQHSEMPAGAEWSWVEAYGNARVDPALAHSATWSTATRHCEDRVEKLLASSALEAALTRPWADAPPERLISAGSGWGALETLRREASGLPWLDATATPFARETMTEQQEPWKLLVGVGFEASHSPGATSFVRGADWEALLEAEAVSGPVLWQLGVMKHARGDVDAARNHYLEALAVAPEDATLGAAAHRGLALIALSAGRTADAIERYRTACTLDAANTALLIEAATALIQHDAAGSALSLIEQSDPPRGGRLRFLHAQALAHAGHRKDAADILRRGLEVPDLREGENSLAALWSEVVPDTGIPPAYQFGMS
jgi:tetratricopeptide (TPR) repeat protein